MRTVHGAALALRSLCDGHHKKAFFIAELPKKNRAFLTAPALAGISSDLMQSQGAMDHCKRWPIGLCADAQIRDDGPNMETYHEDTYRSSRVSHVDRGPDICSPRERGSDVSCELLIRVQRLLTGEKLQSAAEMFDRARRHELFRNGQPGTGQCASAGRRLR
jgi:hypothetical protein